MEIFGIGIHIIIALFFAVHAFRTGQNLFWLFILLAFPLLGSIIYFAMVYLPNSRIPSGAKKVASVAGKMLDPTRELREAQEAFDFTPTAQNRMHLAAALLEAGYAEEAATNYEACLTGPFASDREMRLGAAKAFLECQRYEEAIAHLDAIQGSEPNYRPEQIDLLLARSLAGAGRDAEAKAKFESAMQRFGGFDVAAEYAIFAATIGDWETANRIRAEIDEAKKRWNRHTRELNEPLMRRLSAAYEVGKKRF